ncbi:MAG: DICT sensory domain-containing protein [Dolichospermum sp.]
MLQGSILQQLEASHRHSSRPIHFGVYYKNTLVALCHALEDHILTRNNAPLVIAAFQEGKWYLEEAVRYADIAQHSQQVVIMAAADAGFAEHPTSQLSNVNLVALATDDPVAEEWHLLILSSDYTAMVICQELSPDDYGSEGLPTSDLERKFYGLWTFEPELVQETAELAIAHIKDYHPELALKLTQYKEAIHTHISSSADIATVVARVVDYLKTGQDNLSIPAESHRKSLDHNLVSNEIQAFLRMAQLADINHHGVTTEVTSVVETMGQLLDLPAWQIKRLRLAALLHRIGSLQNVESLITPSHLTTTNPEKAPSCPLACPLVPGAQALRIMPRLRAIAQIITHQTEWWNGSGEPAGLAGDDIPLESRVLSLVAEFVGQVHHYKYLDQNQGQIFFQALDHCRQQQSTRFDPKLVDTLTLLVMALQQGIDLSVITPKFGSGLWLLDSRWDSHSKSNDDILSYKTPGGIYG